MTPAQAILELRALAESVGRDDELPREDLAAAIVNLADRLAGFDPLSRGRGHVIYIAGRRPVTVQKVRAAFGL